MLVGAKHCLVKSLIVYKMYKIRNYLNPSFMQEIFCENTTHYNLCTNDEFIQPRVRSVNNSSESVRIKGPQLWQTLPPTISNSESLNQFKTKIKICTEKIAHVGDAVHFFITWASYDEHF